MFDSGDTYEMEIDAVERCCRGRGKFGMMSPPRLGIPRNNSRQLRVIPEQVRMRIDVVKNGGNEQVKLNDRYSSIPVFRKESYDGLKRLFLTNANDIEVVTWSGGYRQCKFRIKHHYAEFEEFVNYSDRHQVMERSLADEFARAYIDEIPVVPITAQCSLNFRFGVLQKQALVTAQTAKKYWMWNQFPIDFFKWYEDAFLQSPVEENF